MKKPPNPTIYCVPTLLDRAGARHIIPMKDSAAYCGAADGSQQFPHDWKAGDLCPRCLQQYVKRVVLEGRLKEKGL